MRFWLLLCLTLSSSIGAARAATLLTGEVVEGKPAVFVFEDKKVWFARTMTQGDGEFVPTKDLPLRDRQKLLVSPIFYQGFPEDPAWPREKRNLLMLWIFSPILALYIGFWIAGILVAGKFSPIKALYGFTGGWLLGTFMFFVYLFFSSRLGGGTLTVLFGSGMALVLLSFYISAVYSCDVFRGLMIFLLQLLITVLLTATALISSEKLLDRHELERFWNEQVFAPVGLIENPNPFQSLNSDSSSD
ncbi:MAG: hypothetical protein AAF357_02700 [Verrucomicrobiota bacterium]